MRCPTLKELPSSQSGKTGWIWTEESPQLPDLMPNGKPWPKITIVTPSYQQGQFIEETIRSVLLQGYPNLEYIIMDGGSTDNSVEIIRKYEQFLSYWVSEQDGGQSHAINQGWEMAQGTILHWLNSDDLLLPGTLSIVAEEFVKEDNIEILSGITSVTYVNLVEYRTKPPQDLDLKHFVMGYASLGQPGTFISSELYKRVGKLDEKLHYTMDREYYMRISLVYPQVRYLKLQKALAITRQWEGVKSNNAIKCCMERLLLLDRVFAEPNIPDDVRQLKKQVYSSGYIGLANIFLESKQSKNALVYFLKAVYLKPTLIKQMPKFILGL